MSDITKWFIQCNTDTCCEHITGGVNYIIIYFYDSVSLMTPVCVVCLCVDVWDIQSEH